jgi:hypothetical protein
MALTRQAAATFFLHQRLILCYTPDPEAWKALFHVSEHKEMRQDPTVPASFQPGDRVAMAEEVVL